MFWILLVTLTCWADQVLRWILERLLFLFFKCILCFRYWKGLVHLMNFFRHYFKLSLETSVAATVYVLSTKLISIIQNQCQVSNNNAVPQNIWLFALWLGLNAREQNHSLNEAQRHKRQSHEILPAISHSLPFVLSC